MKFAPEFYQHWEEWSVAKVEALARAGDPTMVAAFVLDLTYVTDEFVRAVRGVPTSLPALIGYALSHPDPLKGVRSQIYMMQKKWGI
jgi:hypothetical protein